MAHNRNKAAACPSCHTMLEVDLCLAKVRGRPSKAGDSTICGRCGAQLIVIEGGGLRPVTTDDRARFSPETLQTIDMLAQRLRQAHQGRQIKAACGDGGKP